MLKDQIEDSVTFDDVLFLPGHSKLLHSEVSAKRKISQTLGCNIPLLSAAIDTVMLLNSRIKLFLYITPWLLVGCSFHYDQGLKLEQEQETGDLLTIMLLLVI